MTPEAVMLVTISAVAAAVVLYLVWDNRHHQEEWERKQDQRDLLLQIQRELLSQQNTILARYADMQRRLDDHHRILKYLGRRLS